jgi:hypothetical protein
MAAFIDAAFSALNQQRPSILFRRMPMRNTRLFRGCVKSNASPGEIAQGDNIEIT